MNNIQMFFILILNLVYAERPADIRQNKISNTCDFDIIRIKRKDVTCLDFGQNKKYCNHYALAKEFVITKENGLFKNTIVIKPESMYEEFSNNKFAMAKFYYSFVCNYYEKEPNLELNIVPSLKYDKSTGEEFSELIAGLILLIIMCLIIGLMCPCLIENNNGFLTGLIIGNSIGSNSGRRVYCE